MLKKSYGQTYSTNQSKPVNKQNQNILQVLINHDDIPIGILLLYHSTILSRKLTPQVNLLYKNIHR